MNSTSTCSTEKPAGAPNEAGAEAFVAYMLSPAVQTVLKADGFDLISPVKVTGSGVPATVQSAVG